MNGRVNLEPGPNWQDLRAPGDGSVRDDGTLFTGSGKAGLALVFGYLRERGVLADKTAEVLVPPWLGAQVYHQIGAFAFPTQTATSRTRAVLAYHQYGFPQNMKRLREIAGDKGLCVVEDCAHACATTVDGRPAGTLGDFAVYSFSKFAFCYALGAVRATDPDFAPYAQAKIEKSPRALRAWINLFKLADEANRARATPLAPGLFDSMRLATYALYGLSPAPAPRAVAMWLSKRDEELAARKRNFGRLVAELGSTGLAEHLERDGVVPYAVPLRPPLRADQAVAELSALGVETGLYRFDYARNVFESDYAPCLLLPCHGGLSEADMARLAEIIRRHHS